MSGTGDSQGYGLNDNGEKSEVNIFFDICSTVGYETPGFWPKC